ncbi:MAG: hypothetical protein IJV26_06915 [Lachnospiraceae bacterium]|nr:hypothetical protein [Lachnospiraceae bacterium]
MKRLLASVLASVLIMAFVTACTAYPANTGSQTDQTPAPAAESVDSEEMILVQINTDGPGEIAFSESGEKPVCLPIQLHLKGNQTAAARTMKISSGP